MQRLPGLRTQPEVLARVLRRRKRELSPEVLRWVQQQVQPKLRRRAAPAQAVMRAHPMRVALVRARPMRVVLRVSALRTVAQWVVLEGWVLEPVPQWAVLEWAVLEWAVLEWAVPEWVVPEWQAAVVWAAVVWAAARPVPPGLVVRLMRSMRRYSPARASGFAWGRYCSM